MNRVDTHRQLRMQRDTTDILGNGSILGNMMIRGIGKPGKSGRSGRSGDLQIKELDIDRCWEP